MCEKFTISLSERSYNMLLELTHLYDCKKSQLIAIALQEFYKKHTPVPFSDFDAGIKFLEV